MNKSELIKALAEESNLPFDDASLVVNTFIDAMKDSLIAGDRIEIRDSGASRSKEYSGYAGRNPKTGESVSVVPKRLPFFRAGRSSQGIYQPVTAVPFSSVPRSGPCNFSVP